jgi:NAD(P)-dependent dehydrogenase (short-subunit alcohol dehydrogenase family)
MAGPEATPPSLDGQVAIVTGGAGGIGAATCERLAEEGARVLVVDLAPSAAGGGPIAVAERIQASGVPGEVAGLEVDVAVPEEVAAMVEHAVSKWGRLDIVVNNAMWMGKGGPAGGIQGNAVELEESSWDYAFDVGLKSQYLATKHAVPHMRAAGGGSIVNIRAANSGGPEGPPGLLGTPSRTPWILSR